MNNVLVSDSPFMSILEGELTWDRDILRFIPENCKQLVIVYLCYSGGSANSYTYAIGLLTAKASDDLTDISVWTKRGTPVVSFYSVEGEYGPGHNSFYEDEEGNLMIAYHGELALEDHLRCDGIRRIHFSKDGRAIFDMSADEDLDEKLREVELQVVVKARIL